MKTSNILLTSAILILIASLIAFNFSLKAEYITIKKMGKEEYTKHTRFSNSTEIEVKAFNTVELISANTLKVKIEYGVNEGVWVQEYVKNRVSVEQIDNRLVINLNKEGDLSPPGGQAYHVTIISPNIKAIRTKAFKFPVKNGRQYNQWATGVYGFTQDSLSIEVASNTNVWLNKNNLGKLRATVGDQYGNGQLTLNSDNNIESIKLNVLSNSFVNVLDTETKNIEHNISDSATVTIRGLLLENISKNYK